MSTVCNWLFGKQRPHAVVHSVHSAQPPDSLSEDTPSGSTLMDMTMDLQDLPMLCLVAICTAVAIAAVHHGPLTLLNYLLDFRYRWHPVYKSALKLNDGKELNLASESA